MNTSTGAFASRNLVSLFAVFAWINVARAEQWDWVQRLTNDSSAGVSIAIDTVGNAFVAGTFTGTNTLGTNVLVSQGNNDVFIAKLATNGSVLWAISAGGMENDTVQRVVVDDEGALFVGGRFSIAPTSFATPPANWVSNAFLARIDNGQVTWARSSDNPAVGFGGVALGPDRSIWTAGTSNRVFLRRYDAAGTLQGAFLVGNSAFSVADLEVNRTNGIYMIGAFSGSVDLGTTNLTTTFTTDRMIVGVNEAGVVRWAWKVGNGFSGYTSATDIACTPDEGVVAVGYWDTGLPQGYSDIVKLSVGGTQEWRRQWTGHRKSIYEAFGVTVDFRGYVHVTGSAFALLRGDYYYRRAAWLLVLAPNGNPVSEEFITSGRTTDRNAGKVIAVNGRGDTFITGLLTGKARFGTNNLGGFSEGTGAFVARRATSVPSISFRLIGTNLTLCWPRTSAPFALQQADGPFSGAWQDVVQVPLISDDDLAVRMETSNPQQFYQLRRTNELNSFPPELYAMEIQSRAMRFPDGSWFVITPSNQASGLIFEAWYTDWNYVQPGVAWYDATGSTQLNHSFKYGSYQENDGQEEFPVFWAQLNEPDLSFPVGTNVILAVASNGSLQTTNAFTFQVIRLTNFVSRMEFDIGVETSGAERTQLQQLLTASFNALQSGDWNAARQHLQEFQTALASSTQLTAQRRQWFYYAADYIISTLPTT